MTAARDINLEVVLKRCRYGRHKSLISVKEFGGHKSSRNIDAIRSIVKHCHPYCKIDKSLSHPKPRSNDATIHHCELGCQNYVKNEI